MYNPFTLEGKTILVTGASSGIGRGIAIACSKMGATLVLNGRNRDRLQETLSALEGEGHLSVAADIALQDGLNKLLSECPKLNGCALCAGIATLLPVKFIDRQTLLDIVNTNEIAPILLISSLVKKKILQKKSSILLIASLSGVFKSKPGESMYASSKGGVAGFVKAAALELAAQNIRVNTICPAFIKTEMTKMYDDMVLEAGQTENVYPLRRVGETSDIENGAIYLLSDASSWVTGVNLQIDGGLSLV